MVKRKLNIPKSKMKDLEGFEDILDLVGIDKAEVHKRDERQAQNFAIYDFLEREGQRLKVLDEFFSTKVDILDKNRQHEILIDRQKHNRNELQKEICQQLSKLDSPFQKFISKEFNKFFDLSE